MVESVFVDPDQENTVTLRLEPPKGVRGGDYRFQVVATGQNASATLPVTLTLGNVLPRRLSLVAELPVLRGSPTSSFRFRLTLKNESDQEFLVNLNADTPRGFNVTFTTLGQEVASLPIKGGESKDLDRRGLIIECNPAACALFGYEPDGLRGLRFSALPCLFLREDGTPLPPEEHPAELALRLEVTGRPELSVTTPDNRLSGNATAGSSSPLKLVVKNNGSAPARNVTFSASEPTGWEVKFTPERADEIPANGQAEVTASLKPSDKSLSGDYMVTMTASAGDASGSADFRITVGRSTLWGFAGVLLIAVALGVVTFAVNRYGRR